MTYRGGRIVLAVLATLLSAGAAARAQGTEAGASTPSRAVGATHSCADYYPQLARRMNESGDVLIGYDVGADGTVAHVVLVKSSGSARLDQAAVQCVSQRWRNTPALQGGMPVASPDHRAIVRFTLQGPSYFPPPASAMSASATHDTAQGDGPHGLLLLLLVIGMISTATLIVLALRQWVFATRICPSCSAVNRGVVPFAAPKYCSRCGLRIPPQA